MRRFLICCIFAASLFLLISCNEGISGRMEVLSGVVSWHNHKWRDSTASFLNSTDSSDISVSEYALYGLALSYSAQNELAAAEDRLSGLLDIQDDKLRSAAWYQKGICEYRKENYREAASCFRNSLEIEPSRTDAKINLELALAKDRDRTQEATSGKKNVSAESSNGGAGNAVFSFIRKREEARWKKSGENGTLNSVPDY